MKSKWIFKNLKLPPDCVTEVGTDIWNNTVI